MKLDSTRWVDDFIPLAQNSWAVPVSWILAQALKHLLAEEETMVFACKDGKLYIQAYRPDKSASESGEVAQMQAQAVVGQKSWADEWPPWP